MKKIDLYILKKFLGTFFFCLVLILSIAVVFDFTEKIDDFLEKGAPVKAIVFDYYLNFIPYFANLFTPLFVFISVIFFTSKMAYQSEIIAILSSGVSFRRMMFPYMIGAAIIAVFSFFLGSYVIPHSNRVMLKFESMYIKTKTETGVSRIHMQIAPGTFVFLNKFHSYSEEGEYLTIEKFDKNKLLSKLTSRKIRYDTLSGKWNLKDCTIRDFDEKYEMKVTTKASIDTTLNMKPSDFVVERRFFETMNFTELTVYINEQRERGIGNIEEFVIEKYRRIASPFSAFILTMIGVSLASRKVRGGMGMHIGVGLGLSFTYILFMTISTTFAVSGGMNPLLAVWIPNLLYALIAVGIYRNAPK